MDSTHNNDWQEASDSPAQARTPVCWTVIVLSVLTFMLSNVLHVIPMDALEFSPAQGHLFPGLFTHMVTHADVTHILFNMMGLYFLGTIVEQRYGTLKFLTLFVLSGIVAAMAQIVASPEGALIGASGAIAGVMAAYVRHFPFSRLYIYGVLPIPAWLFILIWIAWNLVGAGFGGTTVAFIAHLAGLGAGLLVSFLIERAGD